jgi:hypothetical protein
MPEATAAPEPALGPPEVRSMCQGFRAAGKIML